MTDPLTRLRAFAVQVATDPQHHLLSLGLRPAEAAELVAMIDAAEAARDAALARAMPRPMPHGWSKVNHPDAAFPGMRIVGYRLPDTQAGGSLSAQLNLVQLAPDLPIPPTED